MLTKEYWKRLAEDVYTGAVGGVAVIVTAAGFDALTADWKAIAGGALTGAIVALVKGAAFAKIGAEDSPRVK
jgi:hypothetical protein